MLPGLPPPLGESKRLQFLSYTEASGGGVRRRTQQWFERKGRKGEGTTHLIRHSHTLSRIWARRQRRSPPTHNIIYILVFAHPRGMSFWNCVRSQGASKNSPCTKISMLMDPSRKPVVVAGSSALHKSCLHYFNARSYALSPNSLADSKTTVSEGEGSRHRVCNRRGDRERGLCHATTIKCQSLFICGKYIFREGYNKGP